MNHDGNHTIQCPYCFEFVEVWLDPSDEGEFVIDCEVCCRPWLVFLTARELRVDRAQ